MTLIQQPTNKRDLSLSDRVRDSALAAITTGEPPSAAAAPERSLKSAVGTRSTALEDANVLTPGERALMQELLARLADGR